MTHYQYGRYISGVYRAFQMFLKSRLVEWDMRPLEFRILLYLIHNDGASQEQIAEAISVDKSVIARMVKDLIADGYIARKVNERDRRAYQLFRTERAKEFQATMMMILEEWEAIILEEVPEDEREHFSDLMRRVFEHTQQTVREIRQEGNHESERK